MDDSCRVSCKIGKLLLNKDDKYQLFKVFCQVRPWAPTKNRRVSALRFFFAKNLTHLVSHTEICSGQLKPDTIVSFFSASAGATPPLNLRGLYLL